MKEKNTAAVCQIVTAEIEVGVPYQSEYQKQFEVQPLWDCYFTNSFCKDMFWRKKLQAYTSQIEKLDGKCQVYEWLIPEELHGTHISDFGKDEKDLAPENRDKCVMRFTVKAITQEYGAAGIYEKSQAFPIEPFQQDDGVEYRIRIVEGSEPVAYPGEWKTHYCMTKYDAEYLRTGFDSGFIKTKEIYPDRELEIPQWAIPYMPLGEDQKEKARKIICWAS